MKYICIEGCIGVGKTSLACMLAKDWNAQLILEQFEENVFLPKFYKEPDRYALALELSFLAMRYKQLKIEVREYIL
ncbi:MAG TPA: deoxynucleoside kinase [Bacteroidales bacterium]|nr:deoxynucleoside kinase [Bacteroidales bacterium]